MATVQHYTAIHYIIRASKAKGQTPSRFFSQYRGKPPGSSIVVRERPSDRHQHATGHLTLRRPLPG